MRYSKPPLSYKQQAELLLSRGLIADENELINRLENVNYYRLSAYLYPFRNSDDTFKQETTLAEVWRRYTFDRQLRLSVMDAVERIEVAMRTKVTNAFVLRYGPFGYTVAKNLPSLEKAIYKKWLSELQFEIVNSREYFLQHFNFKYGDSHKKPPLWMAIEIMSFGKMLTFYKGLEISLRNELSAMYGIPEAVLKSWLSVLNVIRNICAHHGRMWNRTLGFKPYIPRRNKYPDWHTPVQIKNDKMFGVLTILQFMLTYSAPTSKWKDRFHKMLEDFQDIPIDEMGFPVNWKECPMWG
jgi:abortive infection bacteriophage resistance protein